MLERVGKNRCSAEERLKSSRKDRKESLIGGSDRKRGMDLGCVLEPTGHEGGWHRRGPEKAAGGGHTYTC